MFRSKTAKGGGSARAKTKEALNFVYPILTFCGSTGPGASAKAILWVTSGLKGGFWGSENRKSILRKVTYVQVTTLCALRFQIERQKDKGGVRRAEWTEKSCQPQDGGGEPMKQ